MRAYVVQPGDSPAKIAIRFAGCPKCTADLVAANPGKEAYVYPNGFQTFADLRVGERLNLPDKWFNGALDRMPAGYFDRLPAPPTGVAGPPPLGLGLTVPAVSLNTTPNFVTGPITIQPCHEVYLITFPIPQGIIQGESASVLQALGFTIIGTVGASPTGGEYVHAVNSNATAYTSSASDAEAALMYTAEGFPWANGATVNGWQQGETITGQTSGVTATIASINDDSGQGILTLSNASGQFQWGETVKGQSSGNYATALAFGAVMSSTGGLLGVANLTDVGVNAECLSFAQSGSPCPPGQVQDIVTALCVAPCPSGAAPANGHCFQIVPGLGPPGTQVCPANQVNDSVNGMCSTPCWDGSAPAAGICPPVPSPGTAPAPGTFVYTKGHRIRSVGLPVGASALPASVAGETVASLQAQFNAASPGQWSVVSVTFSKAGPTTVIVVADYCGTTQSLTEPSTGTTPEGTTMQFSHTDLGPSPAGVTCGAASTGPGGVQAPSTGTSTGTVVVGAVAAALGIGGLLWLTKS